MCNLGIELSYGQRASCAITYLEVAAGPGFEPRYTAPEAVVLPLDDPAICMLRAQAFGNIKGFPSETLYIIHFFGIFAIR